MFVENNLWKNSYQSIVGASHIKVEMPNQDAVKSKVVSEEMMITAVADGHGSKKCFRSHKGAVFAVEAATMIFEKIHDKLLDDAGDINTKYIGKHYTKQVVKSWREAVDEDLKKEAISEKDLDPLNAAEKKSIKKNKYITYGSTLIIVFLIKDYIVCYQLGDGDIMFISQSKKVSKPIKRDIRHIANDTSSLCLNKAEKEFKIKVYRDLKHILKMIILSTDGYSNSFSSEKDFLKVGSDLIEITNEDGFDVIDENLKEWIEDTSNQGSGDDTSVSVLTRQNITE